MVTGKQTKPLPQALLRGRTGPHSPCGHSTNKPEPRTSKQPHTNATHRVCLRHLRSCDSRPGAHRLGPWQSSVVAAPVSFDQQPITSSHSFEVVVLGARGTSQIGRASAALQYADPLPTASQQASHSHSFKPPSLSISPCQVGPNTCLLSHKHEDVPALPS